MIYFNKNKVVGSYVTRVNTGSISGVIHMLEVHLNKKYNGLFVYYNSALINVIVILNVND